MMQESVSVDKGYLAKWFVGTALLTTVVGGGLLLTGIYYLFTRAAPSGDTPVVLVGGSIIFKAANKADPTYYWQQDTQYKAYHAIPHYPVASVAIKRTATSGDTGDDQDRTTDVIRVDLSGTPFWEIDEFSQASPTSNPVVSITPDGNYIDVKVIDYPNANPSVTGFLCPQNTSTNPNKLKYTTNSDCSDNPSTDPKAKLAGMSLLVTTPDATGKPQVQTFGTLSCLDSATAANGTCKIVFRDK
jgi:hypothetical protein